MSLFSRRPDRLLDVYETLFANGYRSAILPTSYDPNPLFGLSHFIWKRRHAYHGILLSGDLATSGLESDLTVASDYIRQPPTNKWTAGGQAVLSHGPTDLLIIPGNHDHFGDSAMPTKGPFRRKFSAETDYLDDLGVGYRLFKDGDAVVAIIAGDFTFNSRSEPKNSFHRYGGGFVDPKAVEEMKRLTLSFRETFSHSITGVLWMIHFAPYECNPTTLEMSNYECILEGAKEVGVFNLLCGHTHKSKFENADGVNIFCAGSATSVDCVNTVHEILYDPEYDEITRHNFVWSEEDNLNEFVSPRRAGRSDIAEIDSPR